MSTGNIHPKTLYRVALLRVPSKPPANKPPSIIQKFSKTAAEFPPNKTQKTSRTSETVCSKTTSVGQAFRLKLAQLLEELQGHRTIASCIEGILQGPQPRIRTWSRSPVMARKHGKRNMVVISVENMRFVISLSWSSNAVMLVELAIWSSELWHDGKKQTGAFKSTGNAFVSQKYLSQNQSKQKQCSRK